MDNRQIVGWVKGHWRCFSRNGNGLRPRSQNVTSIAHRNARNGLGFSDRVRDPGWFGHQWRRDREVRSTHRTRRAQTQTGSRPRTATAALSHGYRQNRSCALSAQHDRAGRARARDGHLRSPFWYCHVPHTFSLPCRRKRVPFRIPY